MAADLIKRKFCFLNIFLYTIRANSCMKHAGFNLERINPS